MKSMVKREDTKVWIEGVPDGKISNAWVMLLEGMQIMLEHRGEKVTLEELMAYSGDAFNLCHASHWEQRTEHSVPTDTLTNVAEAYGYASEWTPSHWFAEVRELDEAGKKKTINGQLERIQSRLESGFPVLMGGANGRCRGWRVVVGLDRERKKICSVGGEKPYEWTELIDPKVDEFAGWDAQIRGLIKPNFYGGWNTNAAFLMGEKRTEVSDKKRAFTALRCAVEMFAAKEWKTDWYGEVTYYFGQKAYEQWAQDLHSLDYPGDLEKAKDVAGDFYDMTQMEFQVDQIVRGRAAAARFCEKTAVRSQTAKQLLMEAAKHYREEAETAEKILGVFFLSRNNAEKWLSNDANRKEGAGVIKELLKKEQAAIANIEEALMEMKG
ncbi:MAG: hypothetical protein ACYS8W_12090 [Planctomycetota bacterium]|jgi:hypothetical protein